MAAQLDWKAGDEPFVNPTGIHPFDLRVLVRPDLPQEKTIGGIIIPEDTREKEKYAAVKATVIAIGGNAFRDAEASGRCKCPEPGERVMIAKYAGIMIKGADGVDYRIMNDEDVIARLEE